MCELWGIHEVPRVAEGEYLKMLYSLRELQGAGLELEHLALSQSEDYCTELDSFSVLSLGPSVKAMSQDETWAIVPECRSIRNQGEAAVVDPPQDTASGVAVLEGSKSGTEDTQSEMVVPLMASRPGRRGRPLLPDSAGT